MIDKNFEVSEDITSNGVKFTIKGHINSDNSEKLEKVLQKALGDGINNIVLNMIFVSFLSSAGIKVILKAYQDAHKAGGTLGIEKPSQNVKNVLGMAALHDMLIR